MFIISKFNLLFSSLILLKIIIEVVKGVYLILLKVCNGIEFTLKHGENCHFSQSVRQSGMDSISNPHLSSTRFSEFVDRNHHSGFEDFLIDNLPIGRQATVKHLRKHQATDSSHISSDNPQQRMTVQGTSYPVCKDLVNAVDGKIYINHSDFTSPLVDHGTSRNEVKLQKQANRIEDIKNTPFSSQNGKRANTKIFDKTSDGSSLQLNTLSRNDKSQLNKSNLSEKEASEYDTPNIPPSFVKRSPKLRSSSYKTVTLRQRMQLDITSRNKVECVDVEENKLIQCGETQYFEDKGRNSDSYGVKSTVYLSNCKVSDSPLDEYEIDCQNEDNNLKDWKDRVEVVETYKNEDNTFKDWKDRVEVVETYKNEDNNFKDGKDFVKVVETYKNEDNNFKDGKDRFEVVETNKEANLSCSKDDGRFASCSPLYNSDETTEGSCDFSKDLTILEFKSKEVPLENGQASNVEIVEGDLNLSNAASLDKSSTECSTSPMQVEMSNKTREIEIVENMEKRLENTKNISNIAHEFGIGENTENRQESIRRGVDFTNKDSLSSDKYDCSNNLIGLYSMETLVKDGSAAYIDFLIEAKPVILEIEDSVVDLFKMCQYNPLLLAGKNVEFIQNLSETLRVKSGVMNNIIYHRTVGLYLYEMAMVFQKLKEIYLPFAISGELLTSSSYLDYIRRTLELRRNILNVVVDFSLVFTEEKQVAKAPRRKNPKKKRSRK